MPFSKNLNTYTDVLQVLTAAKAAGEPVLYRLHSHAAAVSWRARAYYFRKLLTINARARAGDVKGFIPTTEWDDLLLEVEPTSSAVRISFGRVAGTLTTEAGAPIEAPPVKLEIGQAEALIRGTRPVTSEDPLINIGLELMKDKSA